MKKMAVNTQMPHMPVKGNHSPNAGMVPMKVTVPKLTTFDGKSRPKGR